MEKQYETPETNVKLAALNLLRHKMLIRIGEAVKNTYDTTPKLYLEDINEVMIVAGLPVITPEEIIAPELKVIQTHKEEDEI